MPWKWRAGGPEMQPRRDRGTAMALWKYQGPRNASNRKAQTRTKDVYVQTVDTALLVRAKH